MDEPTFEPSNPFDVAFDAVMPVDVSGDAHNYASMGYRVFRCIGKKPSRGVQWTRYASNDTAVTAEAFAGKKGLSNIAVVVPENMVVIDVDNTETWETIKQELIFVVHENVPCARTGRGGFHFWFRMPENRTHGNQRGNLPPHIDVRGGGKGYLIAPPSLHPDTNAHYEWLPGRELRPQETIPKIPGVLWKLITGKTIVPSLPAFHLVAAKEKTIAAIQEAADGDRNEALNRNLFLLARKWAGGGRNVEELREEFIRLGHDIGAGNPETTVESAIRAGSERPIPQVTLDSEESSIPPTPENLGRLLSGAEMYGVLGYNVRRASVELLDTPPWVSDPDAVYPRGFEDTDAWELSKWLNRIGCAGARPAICATAAAGEARQNPVDHVAEYLEALPPWDGEPRIDTWLRDYCGVEDTPLYRKYAAITLIGAVARALEPGCKMDTCMVLCGKQGARKSSVIAELAGGALGGFSDAPLNFQDDVRLRSSIHDGQWLHEIKEIDQFTKIHQGYFKDILDTRADKFIPKYGRFTVTLPRRSIFIATTNVNTILRDPTGSRRYLPVAIKEIYYLEVRRMRDQLWAEAKDRYLAGEPWWLEASMDAERAADASEFEIELVGMETVLRYVREQRPEYLTLDDVIGFLPRNGLLGSPSQHFGALMKELGWSKERVYSYGRRIMRYAPPEDFYSRLEPVEPDNSGVQLCDY